MRIVGAANHLDSETVIWLLLLLSSKGLRSNENIHIMQIIVWQRLQNWRICSVHFSSLTFKVVVEIRSVATEKCLNFRITTFVLEIGFLSKLWQSCWRAAKKKLWLSPAVIHLLLALLCCCCAAPAFLERWKVAPNVTLFNHFPRFSFFKENLENPITSITLGYKWWKAKELSIVVAVLQWHMRNGRQLEANRYSSLRTKRRHAALMYFSHDS